MFFFIISKYGLEPDPELYSLHIRIWIRIRNKSFRIRNSAFKDFNSSSKFAALQTESL